MVDRLFRAYFSEGRDISDVDGVLASIAAEVGLEGATTHLSTDAGIAAVPAAIEMARNMGVTGVPHYFFSYQPDPEREPVRFGVPGAQDAHVFSMVFKKLLAKAEERQRVDTSKL